MITSRQTLKMIRPVRPFETRNVVNGMSYGLGPAGYDIRIREYCKLYPGDFVLASSFEEFWMPDNLLGVVHDKSTFARQGLSVFNTVIEPGWRGYLTLELKNQSVTNIVTIEAGSPIAQVIFHILERPTEAPYNGKYQNQEAKPVAAILE